MAHVTVWVTQIQKNKSHSAVVYNPNMLLILGNNFFYICVSTEPASLTKPNWHNFKRCSFHHNDWKTSDSHQLLQADGVTTEYKLRLLIWDGWMESYLYLYQILLNSCNRPTFNHKKHQLCSPLHKKQWEQNWKKNQQKNVSCPLNKNMLQVL